MHRTLVSLIVAALLASAADDPRAIVSRATSAVRADTAARITAEWRSTVARDANSRDAMLGLATIERLTYDYDAAERHYRALFIADSTRPDRHDVLARLGLGIGLEAQGQSGAPVAELFRTALARARLLGDSTDGGE